MADKIDIILKEERRQFASNGRIRGGLGSFNVGTQIIGGWQEIGKAPALVLDTSDHNFIHSENAKLLIKLYSSLSVTEKDEFKRNLLGYLSRDCIYKDVAYLVFYVLYRTGDIIEALKTAQKSLKDDALFGYSNLLVILNQIIANEHAYLSNETYSQIKEIMKDDNEHNFNLFQRINSAELKLLEKDLEGVNQEVNQDKETLQKEFKKYGFSDDLSETLDRIDEQLLNATNAFDFKGCIDIIRSFTERFFENVSKNLDPVEGKKISGRDSEMVAKFFIKNKLISEDQGNILTSLRHFLSNSGSHRLKSKQEDARLSRNMVIEFCLYILRKYEDQKNLS